ncbi:hypothetical protein NBRC116493_09070 [Aurantivibrio infirmus]
MSKIVDLEKKKNQLFHQKMMRPIKKYGVLFLLFFMFLGALLYPLANVQGPTLDAQTPKIQMNNEGAQVTLIDGNERGHFVFIGTINQVPVKFFYDTGATDIAIPQSVANYLRLKEGRRTNFHTANGMGYGFDTTLDTVAIGHIELSNIDATITPGMDGDEILLGMSFLKHLDIRQSDGKLFLAASD